MPFDLRKADHVRANRRRILAGRSAVVVLVAEGSAPTGMATPASPLVSDGGPGGSFPGGMLLTRVVARGATGQTAPGAESAPVLVAGGHRVLVATPAVAGATACDVYVTAGGQGSEALQGSVSLGATLTISGPLLAGPALPSFSYTAASGILRQVRGVDPRALQPSERGSPRRLMDFQAEFPSSVDFTGVVFVARTGIPNPAAVETAELYEILDRVLAGMVADRWLLRLRRVR